MSVVLVMHEDSEGGGAAQTGSLVHEGAKWYHKTQGKEEARIAAGLAALDEARAKFPGGDAEKARAIYASYVADRENKEAEVLWCEEPVRLVLQADASDPTGQEIVIAGTLDQVRKHRDGLLRVWDIKTGSTYTAEENVLKYLTQQSAYTLAARLTLSKEIVPGGLIYTPGYDRIRGKVHMDNPLTVEQCEDLMLMIPPIVSLIRQGKPVFRPNDSACKWCPVKKLGRPWPKCHSMFKGVYGG